MGEPPGPRVQQRTVEQLTDVVRMVQILDIPVPQMRDQRVASLLHLDAPIPEQVVAVPKISSSSRRSRTVLSEPQTAEQLVEVPTVVSFSSLQQTAEHIIDIVPRSRSRVMPISTVFRTVPLSKKCTVRREVECEGARALELMDAGG